MWPNLHFSHLPLFLLSDFCSRQARSSETPTTHPLPQTHNTAKSTSVFCPTLPRLAPGMSSTSSSATSMNSQCLRSSLSSLSSTVLGHFPIIVVLTVEHTLNTSTGPQHNESLYHSLTHNRLPYMAAMFPCVCLYAFLYLCIYSSIHAFE